MGNNGEPGSLLTGVLERENGAPRGKMRPRVGKMGGFPRGDF